MITFSTLIGLCLTDLCTIHQDQNQTLTMGQSASIGLMQVS